MTSGITLQEADEKRKPPGFFPKLFESVCNAVGEKLVTDLEPFRDDMSGMFRYCYDLESYRKGLTIKEFYPEKNPHEAKVKKEYGNKAYQQGKDLDALYLYTQAIIAAPSDDRELSVALANRSAVLYSLKAYYLALDDIRLALESGYPKELRYKLLERKAKCLMVYKQFSDARDSYKEALVALDESKLDTDKKMKIQKDFQKALAFFDKARTVYNKIDVSIHPPIELPKLSDKNPKYPAMDKCVAFRYESSRGRYAVATRDIGVGEYICVEKALVSHMLPDYMGSNCTHCFKSMKNPLPCHTCTKVMFCSYKCRERALSTYHQYECKLVDFLIASGMSVICFLAYRTISQRPLRFFLDNRDKFRNHDEASGAASKSSTNISAKYLSDDYRNLYNLMTHHSERKTGDMFHRAMLAVMLLRCLKTQGYFGSRIDFTESDILTDDEAFIGTLLVHFLEVYQFNAHEIAQFEMLTKDKEEGAKSVFIGAGVYPTLAMFNHSCDPSVVRYYVEDVVCVQSIKIIRKGDEINENYGPIFFHSPRKDRQERLKAQYWFDCSCVPCKEDWPLMHDMSGDTLNFRCQVCGDGVPFQTVSNSPMIKCSCGTPVPILKALKTIADTDVLSQKAKTAMDEGNLAEAQKLYSQYLTTLDSVIVPPYQDYYKIQQSIWSCIWIRFGNRIIRSKARKPAYTANSDDYDTVD